MRTARLVLSALLAAALLTSAAVRPAPAVAQEAAPTVRTEVVESFDGTPIYTTLFLPSGASAQAAVPLVLRTHGWAGTGEREVAPGSTLDALLDAGYAVLTWDQRGFGFSGGEVQIDKPEFEGRDASALIDHAAGLPELAQDGPGDPRIGWTGGSYAGGIQFATAAFDPRVDVLAPEIAWFDLRYSLYENGVLNLGWASLLYGAGAATAQAAGLDPRNPAGPQPGGLDPEITRINAQAAATNSVDEAGLDYFARSSLATYGTAHPVARPTLVMQGSVDTLFDLSDGNALYQHVRATGAPAKLIAFCGGHVSCPASYAAQDDRAHLDEAILTWFARHLRGEDVDTGAAVEYRTNEGPWRTARDFPPPDARPSTASGAASLVGTPTPRSDEPSADATITAAPSAAGDPQAATVELLAAIDAPRELVGFPRARLDVSGSGPTSHLFLKLVDREAGEVVNLQETPLRVDGLSGDAQAFDLTMSGIAYTLPAGHALDLQVSTSSLMHATARTPAEVELGVEVDLPVREAAVVRVLGADRVATGVAVSRDAFDAAPAVVVARADDYPDALAGGPLAATLGGPLLLTSPDRLGGEVAAEIARLGATRVVVLGGPSALQPAVVEDLEAAGLAVERVAGSDRFETAARIAEQVGGDAAFLVQGVGDSPERGWTDAVVVSAVAAARRQPIVLTAPDSLPAASAAALAGRGRVTVVGGPAAVSDEVAGAVEAAGSDVDRLAGATRYETSRAVAQEAGEADELWLATGLAFPDALTAGPAAAASGGLLLLVDGAALESSPATAELVGEIAAPFGRAVLVGGPQALSPAVATAVTQVRGAQAPG